MNQLWTFGVWLLLMALSIRKSSCECQCGVFLLDTNNGPSKEVYLSDTFPQACERLELDLQCHDLCFETVINITSNGNLSIFNSHINNSSGQAFCSYLERNIAQSSIAGFYRWCQTSWKKMAIQTRESLCCQERKHIRCEEINSTTPKAFEGLTSEASDNSSTFFRISEFDFNETTSGQ